MLSGTEDLTIAIKVRDKVGVEERPPRGWGLRTANGQSRIQNSDVGRQPLVDMKVTG